MCLCVWVCVLGRISNRIVEGVICVLVNVCGLFLYINQFDFYLHVLRIQQNWVFYFSKHTKIVPVRMSSTHVDLGFLDKCEPWLLTNKFFPSKVGGLPAWLDLDSIPSTEVLKCSGCSETMLFLCQVKPRNSSERLYCGVSVLKCKRSSNFRCMLR